MSKCELNKVRRNVRTRTQMISYCSYLSIVHLFRMFFFFFQIRSFCCLAIPATFPISHISIGVLWPVCPVWPNSQLEKVIMRSNQEWYILIDDQPNRRRSKCAHLVDGKWKAGSNLPRFFICIFFFFFKWLCIISCEICGMDKRIHTYSSTWKVIDFHHVQFFVCEFRLREIS